MTTRANKTTQDKPSTADATTGDDTAVHDTAVHDAEVVDTDAAAPAETTDERRARLQRELDDLEPTPAELKSEPETREQKAARLRAELAEVDADARLHGGYKEVPTHIGVLLCGDQVQVNNANATQHFCDTHDADVPFIAFHSIPEELRQKLAG